MSNREVYDVPDLKRVLSWPSKRLSNFESNMRFRTVKLDKSNFKNGRRADGVKMRFLWCRFNIRVQFCTENFFNYMAEYGLLAVLARAV